MATKLNDDRIPLTGGRRTPDSKRVEFKDGTAKTNGGGLPIKTALVERPDKKE